MSTIPAPNFFLDWLYSKEKNKSTTYGKPYTIHLIGYCIESIVGKCMCCNQGRTSYSVYLQKRLFHFEITHESPGFPVLHQHINAACICRSVWSWRLWSVSKLYKQNTFATFLGLFSHVSPRFNKFWLPHPVCGSQFQAHLFSLKMEKKWLINLKLSLRQKAQLFPRIVKPL